MKDLTKNLWTRNRLAVFLVVVIMGLGLGYWLREGKPDRTQAEGLERPAAEEAAANEQMTFVCPMMCVPPVSKSGKCPVCGMELVPVSSGSEGDQAGPPRLKLSSEAMKLAEIETAPAERKFVSAEIRLFGQVEYDPTHLSYSTAYMPGVIDRVYVKRAGQTVRWGEPLFDVYSPEILFVEEELLKAMKVVPGYYAIYANKPHIRKRADVVMREPQGSKKESPEVKAALEKIAAMRHKLSLLGLEKKDIDEVMKRGEPTGIATVYAVKSGIVLEQNAFEGTYVNTGTPIFTIADPRFVWVKLNAYESDYPWIRKGQEVSFQMDAYPGENFKGKVVYVDPVFNTKTRTFDIGAIFPDRGGRMKAGLLVRAVIHARLSPDGKVANENVKQEQAPLAIPASAPLITGKRAVVYVAVPGEEGVFEGREVILGPKAKDYYVVLGGLKDGDRVVVNGNFKIDSALQILAKGSMMDIEGGHSATAHHDPGGSEMMHEDYSERMKSRSKSMDDPMRPAIEGTGEAVPKGQTQDSSTIRHRRPGMHGDSTRPTPERSGY
jgi:Cu(I)/Ag(I) efflux system membrane fusion protein